MPGAPATATTHPLVALLVGPGLWSGADHGIEVAWRLCRDLPGRPLRWLASGEQDRWLSRHDLHHAGIDDLVEIVDSEDPHALDDVAVLVRTGYADAAAPMLQRAHSAGLRIAALRHDDLPFDLTELEAFDVDALVDEVRALLGGVPA